MLPLQAPLRARLAAFLGFFGTSGQEAGSADGDDREWSKTFAAHPAATEAVSGSRDPSAAAAVVATAEGGGRDAGAALPVAAAVGSAEAVSPAGSDAGVVALST